MKVHATWPRIPSGIPKLLAIALALLRRRRRHECPNCGPTARAIRMAQAQWVVAGIDLGE